MTADATTMTSYTRTYLDQTSKREDSLLFRNADAAAIPCNAGGAMNIEEQPTNMVIVEQSASNATGL